MNKRINLIGLLALSLTFSSCKDYLEINKNPNEATYANPQLVLPGALNTTASLLSTTYNDYGAFVAGYQANGFGYSYVGNDIVTYNYTSSSNTGLWTSVFANLKNYQYVINQTTTNSSLVYFNAVARIMKSFNYQLLVDYYGDVPYSEAIKGVDNLTPKYDKAEDVYKACIEELDEAIALIKANATDDSKTKLGSSDIVFKGDLTKWIKFANNLKLRFLIRAQDSPISAYVNAAFNTFSSEGFLLEDALVNPGYSASSANMNPQWTSIHSSYSGTAATAGRSRVPTPYIVSFYNGTKLEDAKRRALVYRNYQSPLNQLGYEPSNAEQSATQAVANYPAWYIGTGTLLNAGEARGILKSRIASTPIFLAAEIRFLLAEAALKGHTLNGSAATNFRAGIEESFRYLNKQGSTNAVPSGVNIVTDVDAYITANTNNYLANFAQATTNEQKLEAIITQKYIALNYIHSHESWNEYRRTSYPRNNLAVGAPAAETFVSIASQVPTAERMPVRLLYPQSEINLNGNVPKDVSPFTSKIFWDVN